MALNQTLEETEADLGENLKRLRLNKNLEQKTLAAQAGVSVRALRNLESGQGSTVKTLLRVVRALGRETWLQTIAPIPSINPLAMTTRATQRVRATSRSRGLTLVKRNAAQRLPVSTSEPEKNERSASRGRGTKKR